MEIALHPFEEYLYAAVERAILAWDKEESADTYAILLTFDTVYSATRFGDEIAYQGVISLFHNTETNFRAEIERASRKDEARWNTAFWLPTPDAEVPCVPEYSDDPDFGELDLRDAWCAEMGILPEGRDGAGRPTYAEPVLYRALIHVCSRVAQALHRRGMVTLTFGRPIPVLFWGNVLTDANVVATKDANPTGLSQGFEEFLLGRSYAQIAAHEKLLQDVMKMPLSEQAQLWAGALVDIVFDRVTPMAEQLRILYPLRSKYDRFLIAHGIRESLAEIGPEAVPILLPLIEEFALKEQFNLRGSSAWDSEGAYTRESKLATDLLDVVTEIGAASDAEVHRLWNLLDYLFQESKGAGLIGWNLMLVARTLHVLRPERYPDRVFGASDNKLLNWEDYGLS